MEETAPPPENIAFTFRDISFTWGELGVIGGCGLFLLIGFIVLLVYLSRRTQEPMGVVEDFERTVLRELTPKAPATLPDTPPELAAAATPVPVPTSSPLDGLVRKLRDLGMLGAFQGTQSLGFGPDAQIYALRAGGTVLILPRMESEAFLAHATKAHAMVVAPTSDGQTLAITPLGTGLPPAS